MRTHISWFYAGNCKDPKIELGHRRRKPKQNWPKWYWPKIGHSPNNTAPHRCHGTLDICKTLTLPCCPTQTSNSTTLHPWHMHLNFWQDKEETSSHRSTANELLVSDNRQPTDNQQWSEKNVNMDQGDNIPCLSSSSDKPVSCFATSWS